MAQTATIPVPRQIPGEDVEFPPFPPVAAVPVRLPMVAWPDAVPEWEDLLPAEQLDHIESCESCAMCEAGRAWGVCTRCGSDPVEALPPFGESRCCGSHVSFGSAA